jgi:hypothetical protein
MSTSRPSGLYRTSSAAKRSGFFSIGLFKLNCQASHRLRRVCRIGVSARTRIAPRAGVFRLREIFHGVILPSTPYRRELSARLPGCVSRSSGLHPRQRLRPSSTSVRTDLEPRSGTSIRSDDPPGFCT